MFISMKIKDILAKVRVYFFATKVIVVKLLLTADVLVNVNKRGHSRRVRWDLPRP